MGLWKAMLDQGMSKLGTGGGFYRAPSRRGGSNYRRPSSSMAHKSTFEIVGDAELINKLGRLKQATVNRILRPAINEGLKPVKQRARELVQVRTGTLRRSIRSRAFTVKRPFAWVTGAIFVDKKVEAFINGKRVYPAKYAHFAAKAFMKNRGTNKNFNEQAIEDKLPAARAALTSRAKREFNRIMGGLK